VETFKISPFQTIRNYRYDDCSTIVTTNCDGDGAFMFAKRLKCDVDVGARQISVTLFGYDVRNPQKDCAAKFVMIDNGIQYFVVLSAISESTRLLSISYAVFCL